MIKISAIIFIEPWLESKIKSGLNDKNLNYNFDVENLKILFLLRGIELDNITINTIRDSSKLNANGNISQLKITGINIIQALKKNIKLGKVLISKSNIKIKLHFIEKSGNSFKIPTNIKIDKFSIENSNIFLENILKAQSYSIKEGFVKISKLNLTKNDTLSPDVIRDFDFKAEKFMFSETDSMYSIFANGINYTSESGILKFDTIHLNPNYGEYEFTSRYKYQVTRIDAKLNNILIHDFEAVNYILNKKLVSSYIETGGMDIKAFRDKRKEFRHVKKPTYQELIYNYPGYLNIDSLSILKGDVSFKLQSEDSNEAGTISFNDINAKILKISNDTIFKTEKSYLELSAESLLMGKIKFQVFLKGRIYDPQYTFSLNGNISGFEVDILNPFLEKTASIYASGKTDRINFSFSANNTSATGFLTMIYQGLKITAKNKQSDDTTALKEKIISKIANLYIINSNPVPEEDVRKGIISYDRDPERFLFHYCAKSILSGMQSSIFKNPKKSKILK